MDRVAVAVGAREDDDPDPDAHVSRPAPRRPAARRGPEQLDVVRLDQRIRQELARQPVDDGARGRLVRGLDRQLHPPADPDGADALIPRWPRLALDGPALRIEDARALA